MASCSGRFEIAFNGEIYNHEALRKDLKQSGTLFRGHSDTEVLLALIERLGLIPALKQCVGMFAIALWDRRDRCLHLARDRFGEKPLYYGWCGRSLVFASELKALTVHSGFRPRINADAVHDVLHRGFVSPAQSIYEDIRQVEPATVVTIALQRTIDSAPGFDDLVVSSYWSASETVRTAAARPFEGTFVEAVDQLDRHLRSAVDLQMHADVPLGAFLSGGVDSSVVTALMQAQSGGKVRSYSIGFHDRRHDEAAHAKAVAQWLGTEHTEWYVDEAEALALVPELSRLFDEPLADASQIPTLILARLARRDVTVALSGDGADEIFGGYPKYLRGDQLSRWPKRRLAGRVAQGVHRWAARPAQKLLPQGISARMPWHRLTSAAALWGAASDADLARELGALNRRGTSYMASELAQRAARPPGNDTECGHSGSFKRRAMLADMIAYLPGDILVKVDRATMASSLESRAPFLDHRIFEFGASLPDAYLFDAAGGKKVLRELLYRLVPRELVDRPKAGFNAPLGAWLRGALRCWAYDTLASKPALQVLDVERCRHLLDMHCATGFDMSARLWPMLVLASWATAWIPGPASLATGPISAVGEFA